MNVTTINNIKDEKDFIRKDLNNSINIKHALDSEFEIVSKNIKVECDEYNIVTVEHGILDKNIKAEPESFPELIDNLEPSSTNFQEGIEITSNTISDSEYLNINKTRNLQNATKNTILMSFPDINNRCAVWIKSMAEPQKKFKRTDKLKIFIEEVQKFKALYDKTDRQYKDICMKKNMWTAIGVKFGMSGIEAEKKWKVQRDRYNREKKKIRMSIANGSPEIYSSNWELFSIMDNILRTCTSQNESSFSNINPITIEEADTAEDNNTLESDIELNMEENIDENSHSEKQNILYSSSRPSSSNESHHSKQSNVDGINLNEALKGLNATSACISNYFISKYKQSDDIISKFCDYLQARLRNLDSGDRRDIMHHIEKLMIEKESQDKYL